VVESLDLGSSSVKKKKATILLAQMREDIRAMNSAISILSEKMRHLTRNEKILGRNMIVLNKKLNELQERKATVTEIPEELKAQIKELQKEIKKNSAKIEDVRSLLEHLKDEFVTKEQFKELKYLIDSINPLDYVTVEQLKELVDERIDEKLSKKKFAL
jgi:chromosome segregation ATPase